MVANIDGKIAIVDYKTTYKLISKNCRVQLEAYSQAMKTHGVEADRKLILHLSKNGTWKEHEYMAKDAEAWSVFTSLKCIHDYMMAK